MNKPIYKLAVLFPGILKPTYSEAEYKKTIKDEMILIIILAVFWTALFIAFAGFVVHHEYVYSTTHETI